jgi:hypothetical protein
LTFHWRSETCFVTRSTLVFMIRTAKRQIKRERIEGKKYKEKIGMSKLSQTTSSRRELNVLLSKPSEPSTPQPISSQGAFSAYLNCTAVVVVSAATDSNSDRTKQCTEELWTADLCGVITIRSVATGRPLANPRKQALASSDWLIPSLDGVPITAIAQVRGGAVWATFLDGYVRGYDAATKALLFETRKHTGGLNAMALSPTMVFTAGDDFRLGMWVTNADGTPNVSEFASLKAHTSSIRCIATMGDFVYTGADDGLVRCFSISQKGEVVVPGQYPIYVDGAGSVRGIAIYENCLFIAGKQGVTALDIETCQEIHRFSTGSVHRVTVVAADITLWCACANGTMTVYDLLNYELIGHVDEHEGALVRSFEPIARSVTNRLFLLSTKGLHIVRTEVLPVGGGTPHDEAFASDELRSFVASLNTRQAMIAEQSRKHRASAAELRHLVRTDGHTKRAVVAYAAREHLDERLQSNYERARVFFYAQQHRSKLQLAAKILARHTNFVFAGSMFRKMRSYARMVRSVRHREGVVKTIHKNLTEGLRSVFTRETVKFQRKQISHTHRSAVAEYLHSKLGERLLSRSYHSWRFYLERNRRRSKYEMLSASLQQTSAQTSLRHRYFGYFLRYFLSLRRDRLRERAIESLAGAHSRISSSLLEEHATFASVRVRRFLQETRFVEFFGSTRKSELRRSYFGKWKAAHFRSKKTSLELAIPQIATCIQQLDEESNDPSIPPSEALDADIASLQRQLEALQSELEAQNTSISLISNYAVLLAAERSSAAASGGDTTPGMRVHNALSRLKPSCVNFRTHSDAIQAAFKAATAKPAAAFIKGIERWRSDFSLFSATPLVEGGKWPISAEQISRSQRSTLSNALTGIREAVIAWDVIVGKGNGLPPTDVKYAAEIVANVGWAELVVSRLLTLAAEDPLPAASGERGPTAGGTSSSSRTPTTTPRAGGLSANTRPIAKASLPSAAKRPDAGLRTPAPKPAAAPSKRSVTPASQAAAKRPVPAPVAKRSATPPTPKRAPSSPAAASSASPTLRSGMTPRPGRATTTTTTAPAVSRSSPNAKRSATPPASNRAASPANSPRQTSASPATTPRTPRAASASATTPRTPRAASVSPSQRAGTLPPKATTPRRAPAAAAAPATSRVVPAAPAQVTGSKAAPARRAVKAPPKK